MELSIHTAANLLIKHCTNTTLSMIFSCAVVTLLVVGQLFPVTYLLQPVATMEIAAAASFQEPLKPTSVQNFKIFNLCPTL